jgi:hypothetical protein
MKKNIDHNLMGAIAHSFSEVEKELNLLNKRLSYTRSIESVELSKFDSEIQKIKINFDQLHNEFKTFDNKFFDR